MRDKEDGNNPNSSCRIARPLTRDSSERRLSPSVENALPPDCGRMAHFRIGRPFCRTAARRGRPWSDRRSGLHRHWRAHRVQAHQRKNHYPYRSVSSTRASTPGAAVERTSAYLRNWKILNTGYRSLLPRFQANLQLVTCLEIYRAWTVDPLNNPLSRLGSSLSLPILAHHLGLTATPTSGGQPADNRRG